MFNCLKYYNRVHQYTYIVETPPTELPLTVDEVKAHLKLDDGVETDAYLTGLIETVRDFFEKYTTRILINTQFKTYRDYWWNLATELRKSKLKTIDSIKYYTDNVLTLVDSALYYATLDNLYSAIILKDGESWPDDIDTRVQAIEILFVAGFGVNDTFIPYGIKTALLNHIAYLYENRGDCDITNVTKAIPNTAKLIYDLWKIGRDGAVC